MGYVVKCPHCDVCHWASMHKAGWYSLLRVWTASAEDLSKCGSKHISGFKAGTQKIEEMINMRFPTAGTIRMDYDTTRKKDSYEKIPQAFRNHEADILIGTQMIVKVMISRMLLVECLLICRLNENDYRAAENFPDTYTSNRTCRERKISRKCHNTDIWAGAFCNPDGKRAGKMRHSTIRR